MNGASPKKSQSFQPQALFEKLFEFSPDAIVVTNQDGRITNTNAQVERAFGYTREELLGQPVEILIPERFRNLHPKHRSGYTHDPRVRLGVFNHVSMYFSDVVWTGLSTQNVRQGFEGRVSQEELRHYWSVISPASYLKQMQGRETRNLLVWARHDSTFLPVYSQQVLESFRQLRLPHQVFTLPCGHYTTGQFPFNLIDGLAMCRFAARWL